MRVFAVYHHPVRGYEAVKNGFSWPGFFFTWIWAFAKGLPGIAVLLLVACLLTQVFWVFRDLNLLPLGVVGVLAVALVVGFQGNHWREKSLTRRGYRLMEILLEKSPDAAISKIYESTNLEKAIEAAVSRALEREGMERKRGGPGEAA
jgi:hypothetical protein